MKQGRKSKTVLALGCVLAALGSIALASPALAQGPAESEYDLGPLPGAAGDNGATAAAGGEAAETQATAEPVAAESDGGGAPVLLIALITVAAICTGLAIWRLRRGDSGDDPHGVGPTTGERQSV